MSDRKMLGARIPKELKDLVDADPRDNQEIVEAALWNEFGGRKKSALEAKKEHKLQQLEAIEASIESEQEDKQRVLQEIEAINGQIEKVEETDSPYETALKELVNTLEKGGHLWPSHKQVKETATKFAKDPEVVIDDLRERAGDDITEDQFEQP